MSMKKGEWQPEEKFEVEKFPGAKKSRLAHGFLIEFICNEKDEEEEPIFIGLKIFINGITAPPNNDMAAIITSAGGEVVSSYDECTLCICGPSSPPPRTKGGLKSVIVKSEVCVIHCLILVVHS